MAEHEFTTITLAVVTGVATITLSRADKLNAFNSAMQADLRDALTAIESDRSIRAVILTGAGRAFSAGQDLIERRALLAQGDVDLGALLDQNYNPLIRRLAALPVPVIAAVNGVAAGAAAAIALGCDITIAARSASFQFPFVRVGLAPDAGTSWLLTRLLGPQRAMLIALTAGNLDAETAAAQGIIARMVDDGALLDEATTLARSFATGARDALAATKALIRAAATSSFDDTLDAERDTQRERGRSSDYLEAITAFADKRAPVFSP